MTNMKFTSSNIVDKYWLPMKSWEQEDLSIVDAHGNIISSEERFQILESVASLPVTSAMDDIIDTIANNTISIIQSPTWSGKSTQVVKAALKACPWKTVIATQPRVIWALSIADRVSKELMAEDGNVFYSLSSGVWYKTWQTINSKNTSNISFHTDGLELRRQMISDLYPDVMIIDEIHGYSIPIEHLLMNFEYQYSKWKTDTKLVLMSATMDPSILQNFFKKVNSKIPVVSVSGRTFPVTSYHNPGQPIEKAIWGLIKQNKNVLVFLPWKREISEAWDALEKHLNSLYDAEEIDDIPEIFHLHSEIPVQEQQELLKKKTNIPRVILATNIAEESITINYINAIVDSGKEKIVYVNDEWIDVLVTQDISQANAKQREWRAWRVQEWEAISVNETAFEELNEFPIPSIQRELLDTYILLDLTQWIDLLDKASERKFLHKPHEELLKISYHRLKQIWAINSHHEVTQVWIDLLKLPLSIYNGLFLNETLKQGVWEEAIIISAIIEKKWFLSKDSMWKKIQLVNSSHWDLFWYLDLYKLITSRQLSKEELQIFQNLWLSQKQIDLFVNMNWEKKFFEVVELDRIWIKTKRIYEIFNLIENLKERLETLKNIIPQEEIKQDSKNNNLQSLYWEKDWIIYGTPISQDKIKIIKMALLSWYQHFIFTFDKKEKKFVSFDKTITSPFELSATSYVKADEWYYVWIPFIIWWIWKFPDFHLLSNVTPIEKELFTEFLETKKWLSLEEAKNVNEKLVWKKITVQDLHEIWAQDNISLIDEVQGMFDVTKSSEYLAKNWLPSFLILHNKSFRSYIQSQWKGFDVSVFIEKLKIITKTQHQRILPHKLSQTEAHFREDKIILDLFLNSWDKNIQKYLWSLSKNSGDVNKNWILIENDRELRTTQSIWSKITEFILLLWKCSVVDLYKNRDEDMKQIIQRVVENTELDFPEFSSVVYELKTFNNNQIRDFITILKSYKEMSKSLKESEWERKIIWELITILQNSLNTTPINAKSFSQTFLHPLKSHAKKIKTLSRYNIKTIDYEYDRFVDTDKRKQKSARNYLETKLLSWLQQDLQILDSKIDDMKSALEFSHFPFLHDFRKYFIELLYSLYKKQYVDEVLFSKVNAYLIDILQSLWDKKDFKIVLKKIVHNSELSYFEATQTKVLFYETLDALHEEYENFKNYVLPEIRTSRDMNYIQNSLEKLKNWQVRYQDFLEKYNIKNNHP